MRKYSTHCHQPTDLRFFPKINFSLSSTDWLALLSKNKLFPLLGSCQNLLSTVSRCRYILLSVRNKMSIFFILRNKYFFLIFFVSFLTFLLNLLLLSAIPQWRCPNLPYWELILTSAPHKFGKLTAKSLCKYAHSTKFGSRDLGSPRDRSKIRSISKCVNKSYVWTTL